MCVRTQAAPKAGGADQGGGGSSGGVEASIKTCCDNVQKRIQKEFDRNIDILDRYIKKNVAAVAAPLSLGVGAAAAVAAEAAAATTATAAAGGVNNGAAPAAGGWSARAGAGAVVAAAGAAAPAAGGGAGGEEWENRGASSAKGEANSDSWLFDVDEATPPKRLEEEEALDAEIQQLRKRRREVGG